MLCRRSASRGKSAIELDKPDRSAQEGATVFLLSREDRAVVVA